jgi:hypothetical protein
MFFEYPVLILFHKLHQAQSFDFSLKNSDKIYSPGTNTKCRFKKKKQQADKADSARYRAI